MNDTEVRQPITQRDEVMRETLAHVRRVGDLLTAFVAELTRRAVHHDASKFDVAEFEFFVRETPALKAMTYGSNEYKASIERLQVAIDHHTAANRHHPEHHDGGVDGMTLIDLAEMLCDWKAASERHTDGSVERSLRVGRDRFDLSPQLESILRNTAREFGWLTADS